MRSRVVWTAGCLLGLLGANRAAAQCPDGTPPPCRAPDSRPPPAANSVAVLYFENNSPDTADVYLADGLTDELITQLGRIGRLAIAPRSAVRRYRGQALDPAVLARGLSVSHLVSGSVRRAGSRLRVDVELVRMPGQRRIWGESYQRTDGDLFAIQEDIARAITRSVSGALLPAERAALARAPTRNPAAYDLYLRASRVSRDVSSDFLRQSIALLEQALRLDPGFTAARGRLAFNYSWAINWSLPLPGAPIDTLLARAASLAAQAIREDSTSSDAWMGRAYALFFRDQPDYEGSLVAAHRAVALDLSSSWAQHGLSVFLRRAGRFAESERALHRTLAIEPGFDQAIADLGFVAMSRRRYAEALRWYDSVFVVLPSGWQNLAYRSRIKLMLGDTAGARADARLATDLVPAATRHLSEALRAGIEGRGGDTAAARERIEPVFARFQAGPISVRDGYELAGGLLGAGDRERALDVLERIRPRGYWLWSYLIFADFDPLRSEARFQRVFREAAPPGAPSFP